jgi:hypothetical protein
MNGKGIFFDKYGQKGKEKAPFCSVFTVKICWYKKAIYSIRLLFMPNNFLFQI